MFNINDEKVQRAYKDCLAVLLNVKRGGYGNQYKQQIKDIIARHQLTNDEKRELFDVIYVQNSEHDDATFLQVVFMMRVLNIKLLVPV